VVTGPTILIGGTNSNITAANGLSLTVKATGSSQGAITVQSGGNLVGTNSTLNVEASGANGAVDVQSGGLITGATLVKSDSSDITIEGKVSTTTATAGHDVIVTGSLTSSTTTAANNVTVTGGTLTDVAGVTATNGAVAVTAGGVIQNSTDNTDLIVTGQTVSVDGANSIISKTGIGNLTVEAKGADPTGGYSLTVSNFGQILGNNTGSMQLVTPTTNGSIAISANGTVERSSSGELDLTSTRVLVDGTLKSDAGNIVVGGNSNGGNPTNYTFAAGTTNASGDLSVSGTLYSGSVIVGGTLTNTGSLTANNISGNSFEITNALSVISITAKDYIHVTSPSGVLTANTVNAANILVENSGSIQDTNTVGQNDFILEASGKDKWTLSDPNNPIPYAFTIRTGGQITGGNTGNMSLFADQGTLGIDGAGSKIAGGNTGGTLQVGDVNVTSTLNPTMQINTQLVSVTGGGLIQKTAGTDLTVRGGGVLVDGTNSSININFATGSGNLLIETTNSDAVVGQSAITVSNGGQITLNSSGSMKLGTTDLAGTVNVGGTVERLSTGTLEVDARNVVVNGLLKSDLGDINVKGNSSFTADWTTTPATGTAEAKNNLNVSGALKTGTALADTQNLNVTGLLATSTATSTAGAVQVTGGGKLQDQGGSLAVTGVNLLVDGGNSNIASTGQGQFTVEATGKDGQVTGAGPTAMTIQNSGQITGSNTGDMTVFADQGTVGVTGTGSQITGSNSGALNVGTNGTVTSKQVSVTIGGVIQKTVGGNLTVQSGNILIDGANSLVTVGASATGAFNVVAATTADPNGTTGAVMVSNGGTVAGTASPLTVEAITGSVTVASGSFINAATLVKSDVSNINITGTVSTTTTTAGLDVIVNAGGSLTSGTTTANRNVTVTGGTLTDLAGVTATNGAVKVTAGGVIQNSTDKTDLIVTGQTISVDGTASTISKTGIGNLIVEAQGADPLPNYALSVTNNGAITGSNTGNISIFADQGTVSVAGGTITGANTGTMNVGTDGSVTSKQVSVTTGGVIQKTAGTNLTVQGGNVLVDGAKSLVTAGNGATGAFNVAATGTDSTSATGYA
ncbi:MAG: hypothetical protein DM484_01095, partial [Candidatus Methylumidiphilus alinenensis]